VVAGARKLPATVVKTVIVLVKPTAPEVRIEVGSGVGTTIWTKVVVVPGLSKPPGTVEVIVLVNGAAVPEVSVKVLSGVGTIT
jgi:hypothetical protein